MNLNEKVEQIKRDKKPQKITPRELLSGLNLCKRTSGNCTIIDKYLEKNYCCPIKPLHAAIFSLNPAEMRMIISNFKFQAP
ncbi:hypothetical protein [Prevotella jejuni]